MSFEVQVAHSVQEIGQEAWDRLSGGRPFSSYRWYRLGETVLFKEKPIYVMLSRAGEPVARAALRVTRQEQIFIESKLLRYLVQGMLKRWPILLCQAPFAGRSGLVLPEPPLRDKALAIIGQIVQEQARKQKASFAAFAYLEEYEADYPGWPVGFAKVELPEPVTRLEITWPDFESYLKHLSKKRRKHYRQHCRYTAEMGVEITLHPTVTDLDKAVALIENVEDKYSESFYWTRKLLENADIVDAVWIAARADGKLVGCELVLGDNGHWRVLALGRDYDYPYVYFMLGYADIRFAIEQGAKTLYWGECTYDPKRRLGFGLGSNNYVTFVGNGPLFHRFGRWMGQREENKITDPYADKD